jgi:hypothetical protein
MLRAITGFRDQRLDANLDNDNSELALGQSATSGGGFNARTFTQEFQLSGRAASDRLGYVLGLFAFDEAVDDTLSISATLFTLELRKRQLPTAGIFPVVDERRDLKRLRMRNVPLTASAQGPVGLPILDSERSSRLSDYSPNASLSYQLTPSCSAT